MQGALFRIYDQVSLKDAVRLFEKEGIGLGVSELCISYKPEIAFAKVIKYVPNVQRVKLEGLDDAGLESVALWFPLLEKLEHLDLCKSPFGEEGTKRLAQVLPHCKRLREFDFNLANMGSAGEDALTKGIAISPQIKSMCVHIIPCDNLPLILSALSMAKVLLFYHVCPEFCGLGTNFSMQLIGFLDVIIPN